MEGDSKEVYFHIYCQLCKHDTDPEDKEPCCDCLNEPVNTDSHKPMYFVEK